MIGSITKWKPDAIIRPIEDGLDKGGCMDGVHETSEYVVIRTQKNVQKIE